MFDKVISIKIVVDENSSQCLSETVLYVNGVRTAASAGKGCHHILRKAKRLAKIHGLTQITSEDGEHTWSDVCQQ